MFSVSGGGVFHTEDELTAPFRLLGANPAATPAIIGTSIDRASWQLGAHLRIAGTDNLSVRLDYEHEAGKLSKRDSVGLDVRLKF